MRDKLEKPIGSWGLEQVCGKFWIEKKKKKKMREFFKY